MPEPQRTVSPWLVSFPADPGANVQLVCFPHAGGGAVTFHPWGQALRADAAVHAVQLPGRESRLREPPVRLLAAILDPVAEAIASLADRPVVLFGHSLGAVLAYETARRLRQDNRVAVSALVVSGRPAPHLGSRTPRLAHLPPREIVFRIAELYGGIPAALLDEAELVAMMGRTLQADLEALERYAHAADDPLPYPITAFGGTNDVWVTRDELDAWRAHTRADFSCEQFPGDHFYFRSRESQAALLAVVRDRCRAAAAHR